MAQMNAAAAAESTMGLFRKGDLVEVAMKEDGFLGSYYEAVVICPTLNEKYNVQYKALLKDDGSGPLEEVVAVTELRPVPPHIPADGFDLHDKVDAFDNDGWWVGKVTGRIGGKYFVYFESFGVECVYDVEDLRVHQDWINGIWVWEKRG